MDILKEQLNRTKELMRIITEDDSILDDAMKIVNEKTMLEKVELFRQLVSQVDISRYEQDEFVNIVHEISLEVFTREDIDTLRNLESY
jgi:DNA-binding MltR family transcriptional regulator